MVLLLRRIYTFCGMALVIMTLQRFYLFSNSHYVGTVAFTGEIRDLFVMGFRFDLLVMGFLMIPLVVAIWFTQIFSTLFEKHEVFFRRSLHNITGLWLMIIGVSITAANYFDALQFPVTLARLTQSRFQIAIDHAEPLMQYPFYKAFFSFCALIIITMHLFRTFEENVTLRFGREVYLSFIFTVIVAMAARGTWTPQHLNIRHSEISKSEKINGLVLNPIWSLWNLK